MSIPIWDSSWPEFRTDGLNLSPGTPFLRTQLQNGRARNRRRFTDVPVAFTGRVIFRTLKQAQDFEAWFRYELLDGTLRFKGPIYTSKGRITTDLQFTGMYTSELVGPGMWQYRLPLEMYQRPVDEPR